MHTAKIASRSRLPSPFAPTPRLDVVQIPALWFAHGVVTLAARSVLWHNDRCHWVVVHESQVSTKPFLAISSPVVKGTKRLLNCTVHIKKSEGPKVNLVEIGLRFDKPPAARRTTREELFSTSHVGVGIPGGRISHLVYTW
jgi:hypothetical protein